MGFHHMDKDKLREVAKKGGANVPPHKRSFSQDPELASRSGAKGGAVPRAGRGKKKL